MSDRAVCVSVCLCVSVCVCVCIMELTAITTIQSAITEHKVFREYPDGTVENYQFEMGVERLVRCKLSNGSVQHYEKNRAARGPARTPDAWWWLGCGASGERATVRA